MHSDGLVGFGELSYDTRTYGITNGIWATMLHFFPADADCLAAELCFSSHNTADEEVDRVNWIDLATMG